MGEGEDKISNLPNELIHHIFTFLPIKCAMSTCILSKRWKYVANSIPTLDFRNWRTQKGMEQKKLESKLFMNFLDTILRFHEKPNIQKLYLDLDEFFDESRVYRWISTIMKHRVEEFGLSIKTLSTSSILSCFTCDSLTLLNLNFHTITEFKIPNTVSFPKLKILRLKCLRFVNETLSTRFFSNCPILEELSLEICLMFEGLCIVSPALKHLSVKRCSFSKSTVRICAPNLLTISYTEYLPADYVLGNFPSLVEADVGAYIYGRYNFPDKVVFVKLFEKLSSVKLLKIYLNSVLVLSEAGIFLTGSLRFNNLIHLEISSLLDSKSLDSSILFKFLQLSPNLKSIVFSESIHIAGEVEEADFCWSLDPICSLPHLTSIKFKYFCGKPKELNAVKLFLKYFGFLETLTVVTSPELSYDLKKQIMKHLPTFPKPANCVVKFLASSENT